MGHRYWPMTHPYSLTHLTHDPLTSAAVRPIFTKFSVMMQFDCVYPVDWKKFHFLKNPTWRMAAILITGESPYLGNGSMDLHQICQDDA